MEEQIQEQQAVDTEQEPAVCPLGHHTHQINQIGIGPGTGCARNIDKLLQISHAGPDKDVLPGFNPGKDSESPVVLVFLPADSVPGQRFCSIQMQPSPCPAWQDNPRFRLYIEKAAVGSNQQSCHGYTAGPSETVR